MKCYYCEREIGKDEEFYKFNNEFYCKECVKEETTTITEYIIANDVYEEETVKKFGDAEEYISELKFDISCDKDRIAIYERNKRNDCYKNEIQELKERIENAEIEIKELEQEEGGKTKLIFRKEKLIEHYRKTGRELNPLSALWIQECDGKEVIDGKVKLSTNLMTGNQILEYTALPQWCEEVEE